MMNKKEIFRKIGGIISELTEQYQYLSENLDNLSELELELFTANSKFLTDHAEILKKLNTKPSDNAVQQKAPSFRPETESAVEEEKALQPAEIPIPANSYDDEDLTEENEENQSEGEPEPDIAEPEEIEPKSWSDAAAFQQEEQQPEKFETPSVMPEPSSVQKEDTTSEKPIEENVQEVVIPEKTVNVEIPQPVSEPVVRPTLNDLISARKNQSAGTGINRSPQIKDLKAAISLNDKLMFIKELFNGYSLAYSEAIEILNRFETFDAADAFLKTNYAEKNNWIAKEPVVEKLYELLKNRYSV